MPLQGVVQSERRVGNAKSHHLRFWEILLAQTNKALTSVYTRSTALV
jgi:hypothetical protein